METALHPGRPSSRMEGRKQGRTGYGVALINTAGSELEGGWTMIFPIIRPGELGGRHDSRKNQGS